jgi:CheY-like chemotaxis protein
VNARDAMPRGGRIRIETGNVVVNETFARRHPGLIAGPYVLLAVSDTGVGMDAETQAHIFEPFFTTKEVGKGTGLGLATVYGVVKQSGGYIAVDSHPGTGTTFRIYLPPVDQNVEPTQSSPVPTVAPGGSGTILIAEDERAVRELAREFLVLSGYNVLEARDGAEAMDIARGHAGPIDLLITDVVMPRMGGRELTRSMAEIRPDTKVLYMSGYAEFATHPEQLDGKVSWLTKPFTRTALARMVEQVLEKAKP